MSLWLREQAAVHIEEESESGRAVFRACVVNGLSTSRVKTVCQLPETPEILGDYQTPGVRLQDPSDPALS